MKRVIVVGGGPAGMMAAYGAAQCGHKVTLIEQNEKLIDTVDRLLEKLDTPEEQSELTTEEEKIDEVEEVEEQSKKEDAHTNEESNSDDTSVWDFLKPFFLIISLLFVFTLIMCFG